MKRKLFAIALVCLAIGLLGSCQKDNGNDNTQQNELPAGTLQGKFTINEEGKQVYFSKGILYTDHTLEALHFEANQYSFRSRYEPDHVFHFTWSSNIDVAVSDRNSGWYLFCQENNKVSVDGSGAIYYALSSEEWDYLFDHHSHKWATVNGVNGCVIAPDGFTGTLADSYADDPALAANNLVFFPAAGYRRDTGFRRSGEHGRYWSSSADDDANAYNVLFENGSAHPFIHAFRRDRGCCIRLVTDVNAETE